MEIAITILVPLVIAGIVCLIFYSQMKTAVPQRAADEYIPDGGFNLTKQEDAYLYSTEKREKIERDDSDD